MEIGMSSAHDPKTPAAAASREGFVQLLTLAGRTPIAQGRPAAAAGSDAVVEFWREAGPDLWFANNPAFDQEFRDRFLMLHEEASRGAHATWLITANSALGLVLLLDQFPRNAFRGTARMYATDTIARKAAAAAIDLGHHQSVDVPLRVFFCLPFAHSEHMADQDRSVALARDFGEPHLSRAEHHREIVRRFGRFPHRNPILGRTMTAEEQRFLDDGGYAG
jgi:uncharacterized protein (DUF924 family)